MGLERLVVIVLFGVGFAATSLTRCALSAARARWGRIWCAQFLGSIEWFVAALAPRLEGLATFGAVTVGDAGQVLQDVRGFLEYGLLNVFFGGLEARSACPSPKVCEMMAEEHLCNWGDSTCTYVTINYSLTTSSFIEYKFVAELDALSSEGWPVEDKIRRAELGDEGAEYDAIRASGAKVREPLPLPSWRPP